MRIVYTSTFVRELKDSTGALRSRIKKPLDKLELLGPRAGELLDNELWLYELKFKRPPIKIYFGGREYSSRRRGALLEMRGRVGKVCFLF